MGVLSILWSVLKKVGIIVLFVLFVGYVFRAPVFTEFGVNNLIEYVLVLIGAGHFNYVMLKKEIYPLFRKNTDND